MSLMRAHVKFEVRRYFDASPRELWDELVDWKAHEQWIPMTRVELGEGDPTAPGHVLTAWTGPGPLALEDVMRVEECEWDDEGQFGTCVVEKLGPVLSGHAGFTILTSGSGATMEWFEDVSVKYVPSILAPIVRRLSAAGFSFGMRRLERNMRSRRHPSKRGRDVAREIRGTTA